MTVHRTKISMTERVSDIHCEKGKLKAGQLLKWMDIVACLSAEKCANSSCVTAKVDDLQLKSSIDDGQVVILEACINCAWNTSCEVGIRVECEDLYTGILSHTHNYIFYYLLLFLSL